VLSSRVEVIRKSRCAALSNLLVRRDKFELTAAPQCKKSDYMLANQSNRILYLNHAIGQSCAQRQADACEL
jgi:hypothetical protein